MDWSLMMAMMLPVMMIGTVAAATKSTGDEKKAKPCWQSAKWDTF